MDAKKRTLLITLTGRDRPGVTSRLFGTLSRFPVTVSDVEQVVIRGRLVLGVLVSYGSDTDVGKVLAATEKVAADLGMEIELATGPGSASRQPHGRLHVTILGSALRPAAIAGIAGRVAAHGANIDRIERLAHNPVTCIEMHVSGADPDGLRVALAAEAARSRWTSRSSGAGWPGGPSGSSSWTSTRRSSRARSSSSSPHTPAGPNRSPRSPRPRCAANSTSKARCASASRCSKGWTRASSRRAQQHRVLPRACGRWSAR